MYKRELLLSKMGYTPRSLQCPDDKDEEFSQTALSANNGVDGITWARDIHLGYCQLPTTQYSGQGFPNGVPKEPSARVAGVHFQTLLPAWQVTSQVVLQHAVCL